MLITIVSFVVFVNKKSFFCNIYIPVGIEKTVFCPKNDSKKRNRTAFSIPFPVFSLLQSFIWMEKVTFPLLLITQLLAEDLSGSVKINLRGQLYLSSFA